MSDNENQQTSAKAIGNEKFSDLKWIKLFTDYPAYKELFEKNKELTELFEPCPEWAETFASNPKWFEFLDVDIKVARFFKRKPAEFWSKQGWFDQIAKKLEEPGGPQWVKQLADDVEWNSLFDDSPEWALVYAFELEKVNERRKMGKTSNNNENLVGLAFSGGGIRSASFGLGVLEALRDFGLLEKIDYLSTVSGGGYIGAWLSANCNRAAEKGIDWLTPGEKEDDKKELKKNWNESIRHLRRYSNYLSPKVGLFSADTWSIATVWLRNTLLVQLTVILGIAALLLIPRLLFSLFKWWPEADNMPGIEIDWRWTTVALYILGIAGIAGNSWRINRHKISSQDGGNWYIWFFLAIAILVIARVVGTKFNFHPFILTSYRGNPTDLSVAIGIAFLLVLSGFFLLPGVMKLVNFWDNSKYKINYTQGLVQWLVVLPMMAVSFFVASILWKQSRLCPMKECDSYGDFFMHAWEYWPFPLTVVFVSLFLLSFCCIGSGREDVKKVNDKEKSQVGGKSQLLKRIVVAFLTPLPAMLVLYALLTAVMHLLHGWLRFCEEGNVCVGPTTLASFILIEWISPGWEGKWWLAFVWAPPLVLSALSLAVLILLGMLGRDSIEGIREWWSRLGAWIAICGFAWIVIVVAAVYGPLWSAILYYDGPWKELGSGWIATTAAGLFAGKSASTGGKSDKEMSTKLKEVAAKAAPFVFIAGLLIVVSMILHLVIAINSTPANVAFDISRKNLLGETAQTGKQLELPIDTRSNVYIDVSATRANIPGPSPEYNIPKYNAHWNLLTTQIYWVVAVLFFACLVIFLLLAWRVDINVFSFNAFYRSRLARCYLGATRRQAERHPQNFTGFDDDDDLLLSKLAESNGPLHIVNCALNLGGSCDLALHTRHSAIYTLTPLFCGSRYKIKGKDLPEGGEEIGYTATNKYGGESGQPTLGQAISVSGAAASPNMGYHTSPVTAFLMTLFNVRLGWWFPNPHVPGVNSPSPKFGLKYLLMELLGLANERSSYLSISDGGHFENLAAYELVKRKCKVIIISDGECDPKYRFEGLGTLIRMCEVDFGVKIKIDVRSILPEGEPSWSRNRCAVGKIIYNDKSQGILIYIKASMNGREDTAVMQYKAAHPHFPHETTGDQFYGEDQFESYRSLGQDITKRTFDPGMRKVDSKTGRYTKNLIEEDSKTPVIIECAEKLQDIWSPMPNIGQFTHHTDRLMELWSEISENQSLKSLDEQLAGSWPKPAPKGFRFRSEFYLCSELIQLMENVYLDLDLEETWEHADNKGWRTLFIQWAGSEMFKTTWEMTNKNYSQRFRFFCNRHLHLHIPKEDKPEEDKPFPTI